MSHLLRFKNSQRKIVLSKSFLRSKLGTEKQNFGIYHPLKTVKELEGFILNIIQNPHLTVAELIQTNPKMHDEKLSLYVSTSSRYFTVGTKFKLNRNGYFKIYAKDYQSFLVLYALINSSYSYMWWRFFDGGILFPKSVFFKTPIKLNYLNLTPKLKEIVTNMINNEKKYKVYKKNAGKLQESVKFPKEYADRLNNILFKEYTNYLYLVHNNYEVSSEKESKEIN